MAISKHNKAVAKFNVDTKDFEFKKLADLFDEKKPETVFSVYGLYINRKSKYGPSPFAASDGYFISLPAHLLETVQEILADPESIEQMNNSKAGLVIRPYVDDKGATHYTVDFVDVA